MMSATWGVSEAVITSPFQGEGHGFESRTPYRAHPVSTGWAFSMPQPHSARPEPKLARQPSDHSRASQSVGTTPRKYLACCSAVYGAAEEP